MSMEHFWPIIDCIGDPVFVKDHLYQLVFVNDAACEMFGISRKSCLGKTDDELFPKAQAEVFRIHDSLVLETGEKDIHEELMTDARGHVRIMVTARTLYVNAVGEKYLVATMRDITENKRKEEKLRETERSLCALVDNIPAGISRYDENYHLLFVNPKVAKELGVPAEDLVGKTIEECFMSEEEDQRQRIERNIKKVFETGVASTMEIQSEKLARESDGIHFFDFLHVPEKDENGKVVSVLGISHDITPLRRSEEVLRRLNRELRAISDCNQILFLAEDEQTLIKDICRVVCDDAGYKMVWVGYAEQDEAKTVRPVAWAGVENGYMANANITWADSGRGRGPAGTAIRSGESVYIQDFVTDPRMTMWRKTALQIGFRAAIALPLKDENGDTFGVLTIHSTVPDAFTPDEIRLLEELSGNLAFGITVLRNRFDRKCAEEALLESEVKYRTLVEESLAGVFIHQDGLIRFVNKRFCDIFGYAYDDMVYQINPMDLFHPDEDVAAVREREKSLLAGDLPENVTATRKMLRKDGTTISVNILLRAIVYKGRPALAGTLLDITEWKRAEEALLESEIKYRTLVEDSLAGVFILQDGPLRFVNKRFCEIFGYTYDELVDKMDTTDLFHPDEDTPSIQEEGRAFLAGELGASISATRKMLRKDGTMINVNLLMSVIRYKGRPAFSGTLLDVTEWKRSEDALRASQHQLSEAMDLAHIVYWEGDPINMTFTLNDLFYAFHGTTVEQEGGYEKTPVDFAERFIHPEDRAAFFQSIKKGVAKGLSDPHSDLEYRMIRRDGEERQVVTRTRIVEDNSGRIIKVYGITQDITGRKQMEAAVLESEGQFRKVFEESPFGMIMVGSDFNPIRANAAFCRMLGYTEQELTALTFEEVLHPDLAVSDIKHDLNDLLNGKIPVYRKERRYIRKDKGVVWTSVTAGVMRSGTGQVLYILIMIEDITQQKQAEEEKTLLESQLRQAQKMEAIGTLAGGIAHDFNNMLGVIIGHTELALDRTDLAQPIHENLEEIRTAAQRSADLTRQLLAFARKQTVAPKVLDLNETIEGMLKILRRLIGEDIDLAWFPGSKVWPVKVDPSQIDQILANLCVNARDAISDVGKVTIETGAVSLDADYCAGHPGFVPGDFIKLAVSDNGHGMDKDTQDKIFEPFFTTKGLGQGTGMGLATIYGIVKQNNGFINVYSEPEHGTMFNIYLPRHADTDGRKQAERPKTKPVQGHETILLVEDETTILDMASLILEKFGYHLLTAATPGEAIRLAKEYAGTIHMLITDVVMPDMNGRDLAKHLSSLCPGLKQLFISGYTGNAIAQHGILDEGVHFLQKPFSMQTLGAKVREVLDTRPDSSG